MTTPPHSLGHALHRAVARVRELAGDPVAPVVVLTPSATNGTLARQQLALAADFIRVEFHTPESLVRALGGPPLARRGLRTEPAPWMSATVRTLVDELDDGVYRQPGWSAALARTLTTLEASGVSAAQLRALPPSDHTERLHVFAALLDGVQHRRRVDRLASTGDLCDAALTRLRSTRWAGAVLLGDRLLAPSVHHVLRAWLSERPHVEVRPHAFAALPPSPSGLRSAAHGEIVDVPASPSQRVVLARTPDDVRELGEAVRVVADAIVDGTPLDRIAVVLPDAEQTEVLRAQLARAGIPATWLTGPPLSTRPAAGFLLRLLTIAAGGDTVPAWYELLRQPGLRLRAALGADITEGRGRWRKILARSGAVRHTETIVRAVQAWAEGIDDDVAFDPAGDRRSASNLTRALAGLEAVLTTLRSPATAGTHARRWRDLLQTWWVPSRDREDVRKLLASWGGDGTGPVLSLTAARAELREALERSPALEGTLSDPAIRITTPMGLLGGAFDRVIVTGMTEGRLPRRPGEDALLPDRLITRLNEALDTRLLDSRELRDFEARRLAAIRSSAVGELWLSAPATEMLDERPLLPSSFLLDLAGEQLGRRATYGDLASLQERFGSRARPWPDDPDRAVGRLEHRIATVAADPGAGLRRLAVDLGGRRLLGLHRALDADAPTPWTGLVDPDTIEVPGLDGAPLSPRDLARLLHDPGRFFVGEVLGVRTAPRLYGSSDPMRTGFREHQLLTAAQEALERGAADLPQAILEAWDRNLTEWAKHRDDVTDDVLTLLRALTEQDVAHLVESGALPTGDRREVTGQPIPELPWTLSSDIGWTDGDVFTELSTRRPKQGQMTRDAPEVVLTAMITPGVTEVRVGTVDGRTESADLPGEAAEARARLSTATDCVRAGWWPFTGDHDVCLTAEEPVDLSDPDVLGGVR